jgi:hypothetical protein
LQDFAVLSFVSLIARNSFRSRRRSVLTILSTTASFCMMGVLMSMYSLFFLGDPAPDRLSQPSCLPCIPSTRYQGWKSSAF